jgi:hypothetical protein
LHFRDSSLNGITAIIPHLGQAKLLFGPRRAPRDEPIPKSWVDSPDAISAVFDDPRCPTEACVFDLVLGYQRPFVPAASWRVDLVVPGTGTRTLAWADAATGAAMFNERGRAVYQGQA